MNSSGFWAGYQRLDAAGLKALVVAERLAFAREYGLQADHVITDSAVRRLISVRPRSMVRLSRLLPIATRDAFGPRLLNCIQHGMTSAELLRRRRASSVPGDDFYRSAPWLKARSDALVRAEGKCAGCGSRASLRVVNIKPRSHFPDLALEPSNLKVVCLDCRPPRDDTRTPRRTSSPASPVATPRTVETVPMSVPSQPTGPL